MRQCPFAAMEAWLGAGAAGRSMAGALPGAAALRADPLLTVTSQMDTGAECQEELHGHKDKASPEPQQSLLQALSLLDSDDW